jgi:hypothetical protein
MQHVIHRIILILFLFTFALSADPVSADVGPKPGMEFIFVQGFKGEPLQIISGVLLQCEEADCRDAKPLPERGPQRFTCEATQCSALAYGFSAYNQLEITFSDGITRKSNIFPKRQFNAKYKVTIREQDLLVAEQFNPFDIMTLPWFCLGFACLTVVLIVAIVVAIIRRSKKKS